MIICAHCFIIQNKFVPSHLHTMPEAPMGRRRWADIYIKGVSVRFGFDILRTSQIQTISQEQSNKDRPWDVYIHFLSALGRQPPCCLLGVTDGGSGTIYNIGVGLSALLVSTNRAMRRPSECGTSNRRLHVSLMGCDGRTGRIYKQ